MDVAGGEMEIPEVSKTAKKNGRLPDNFNDKNELRTNGSSADECMETGQFYWKPFLDVNPNHDMIPVPVSCFKGAHLSKIWDDEEDVKVEYHLGKGEGRLAGYGNIYWIGMIVEYFGYLVKVRPEGYPTKSKESAPTRWINYVRDCSRIGTVSLIEEASLIPPLEIIDSEEDWRQKIIDDIGKGITIHQVVHDEPYEIALKIGTVVEALDHHCVSRMKACKVVENIGGKVHVVYWDEKAGDITSKTGFWCHELSGLVVPPGWSKTVDHDISHPEKYKGTKPIPLSLVLGARSDPGIDIQVGMMLEAVDPLKPALISVATVCKVLKFGFIMISFLTSDEDDGPPVIDKITNNIVEEGGHGNDWVCYHVTSPLIFYCGFAKEYGINLTLPKEFKGKSFTWEDYLKTTGTVPLNLKDARPYQLSHGFKEGMKLEATDLVDPSLICLATVSAVKGRLLKIHFDGWNSEFDQWMDVNSHDIFPVGWCDTFGYPLQGPAIGTEFWKKYRRPALNAVDQKFEDLEELQPKIPAALKSPAAKLLKRKVSDCLPVPVAALDHEKTKAEAVILGQRPTPIKQAKLVMPSSSSEEPHLRLGPCHRFLAVPMKSQQNL